MARAFRARIISIWFLIASTTKGLGLNRLSLIIRLSHLIVLRVFISFSSGFRSLFSKMLYKVFVPGYEFRVIRILFA
jgi:hypothetical protein